MEPFLHKVASQLWKNYPHKLEQVLVVFNNRRAGLFLQQELQKMDSKPFFLPRIIGIDDLIYELGGQQIAQPELLLFELYDIHRRMEGEERRFQTFEEFIPFGEMMLGDFSEIDLYCADAQRLFDILSEHKKIGEWDPEDPDITPFQKKYLAFFHSLYSYYTQLREPLSRMNQAYMGMAYRNVAENIESLAEKIKEKHIYFIGFNALSTCETRIIKHFIEQGSGHVIFDGDDYYYLNETQEAGLFLRQHAQLFPKPDSYGEHFATQTRTIHIVNCPENVLQTKKSGHILRQIVDNTAASETTKKLEDTAIVLADENLLIPMLNSLPNDIHSANVTMGYPYIYTETHNLVTTLLSLYTRNKDGRFYHTDLTTFFANPIISNLLGSNNPHTLISQQLREGKIIYVDPDETASLLTLVDKEKQLFFLFQNARPSVMEILNNLQKLAELIVQSESLENNVKETEALACMVQIFDNFKTLQSKHKFIDTTSALQKIYERVAQRRKISFYGEPLAGLQLLGMLETRNLDFERLILLSVNEGTLPTGKNDNSLIPYFLKKEFHIPTFKEKDAVYAYHFYRMLQRCHEAWLLYSSESGGMGKGEPSRFLLQIKNELAIRYPNIHIVEEVVATRQKRPKPLGVTMAPKDDATLQRLYELATKGFAPSALNCYRNCPLKFYYEYVLGAREQDELNEEIESNELGSFIHDILCNIYNIDKDKSIKAETLSDVLENLNNVIDQKYKTDVLRKRSNEGKNHLYGEVAKMQIGRFLKKEIEYLKAGNTLEMLLTEYEMKVPLPLSSTDTSTPIYIKGIADRVDRVEGHLRIADYKSGNVEEKELQVADESPDFRSVPDKWFQVMAYAWLFCRQYHYSKPFCSGIFPLRMLRADFMAASWNGKKLFDNSDIDRFEQLLTALVSEMLDPSVSFTATPQNKKTSCAYCPFVRSCHIEEQKTVLRQKKI